MSLISAIMPTTSQRAGWIPLALRCWNEQTYENRELIVVGPRDVAKLLPTDERIRFIAADNVTLGIKRNLGVAHARGNLIAHWDDDDWYAPWRLHAQLQALRGHSTLLAGERTLTFFDARDGTLWQYTQPSDVPGAPGATLFYERDLCRRIPFFDMDCGEDVFWCMNHKQRAAPAARIVCIASSHGMNTSRRRYTSPCWRRLPERERVALPGASAWWFEAARAV